MTLGRMIVIAAVAVLTMAAAPAPRPAGSSSANWNLAIATTPEGGYRVGNPNAAAKLIEYVSYTCSHCAQFEMESDTTLRMTFIASGKGSLEIRPLMRNKIDVAVTLLATCGPIAKFRGNHTAFLRGQAIWYHPPSKGEEQRWSGDNFAASMRAIANDLKLYDVMTSRGYTRPELDRCLMNRAMATRLATQTQFAFEQLKIQGTPSFIVNGTLLDAHDWDGLRPRLMELTR